VTDVHYGSRSERGTEVAELCYSLLESAKLAGVDPARYLAEATRRAIATPGTITLPRDLVAAVKAVRSLAEGSTPLVQPSDK
jgi:hypothetical protein